MSTQLQYTLQRSHPSSALSYPIPKTLLLSPTSKSISKVHSFTMAPSASHTSSKAAFITKDYYSSALSPSSASTWSADSSDDSDCDRYDSSDEFCFDDIESRSSKSSSRFSSRASTSSSTSSPVLCTCDKPSSVKPAFTVGDSVFENQATFNDYNDLVRSQTRNAAKRRASSSNQTSSLPLDSAFNEQARGRRRQRHLHKLEEQSEERSYTFQELPQAKSVREYSFSRAIANDYTSSFHPAMLAAKLNALLVTSPEYSPSFPSLDSLPSLRLDSEGDDYNTDEETDIEEAHKLTKVQAHEIAPRKALKAEDRFERALAFANWNKRGRAGVWESPDGVSETVRELVASIEMQ